MLALRKLNLVYFAASACTLHWYSMAAGAPVHDSLESSDSVVQHPDFFPTSFFLSTKVTETSLPLRARTGTGSITFPRSVSVDAPTSKALNPISSLKVFWNKPLQNHNPASCSLMTMHSASCSIWVTSKMQCPVTEAHKESLYSVRAVKKVLSYCLT